jgi:hypothetical protein
MVNVPERAAEVLLGAAAKTTFEFPPLPLEVMVSHDAFGSCEEDHVQAPAAVTVTLPVPPG